MFTFVSTIKQKFCFNQKTPFMPDKKIFTYVSPKTNKEVAASICNQLPIILKPYSLVEDLFPLLSNSAYHTDFVCISIDMFQARPDGVSMFDIIHTLAVLIKSTVYRPDISSRPQKRATKIYVIVDETTDPRLIKEVMTFPDICSVGWITSKQEDLQSTFEHLTRMANGDYSHHSKVLELLKPKKKKEDKKIDKIILTVRQSQVLQLVQDRGASNKTIARMLGLSESTVKLHMGAILKKYGVKNRTQLAVFSKERN